MLEGAVKPINVSALGALVLLVGFLLAPGAVTVAQAQQPEPYLTGPQGPYRGRVLDAETGKPLPGALVVAIWQAEDAQFKEVRRFVAAREVLTNAAGEFLLDASAVETNLPPRALPPRLFIYTPGYVAFPNDWKGGALAASFTRAGSVVRLRKVTTPIEDSENFSALYADNMERILLREESVQLPEFSRIWAEEARRFERMRIDWAEQARRKRKANEPACPTVAQPRPGEIGGAPQRPTESGFWQRYLQGYHGPYRGRVIDAETKQPLAGAVVVARWDRDIAQIVQSTAYLYEVCEVLTDANGEFVLQAEDVERHPPPRTLRPIFVIFFPGYRAYPFVQQTLQGVTGGNFEGAGATVEMPPLKTREERRKNIQRIYPHGLSDAPFTDLPNFMRLVNSESVSVGLQPYQPQKRRP